MDKKLTDTGAKARQRADTENRALEYSNWHRNLDKSLYMVDVDFIEWRFVKNKLVAVGVMEITKVDKTKIVNETYLNNILSRFNDRDLQAKASIKVAKSLNTHAYIILYREGCKEFWVHCLTRDDLKNWYHYNENTMHNFLKKIN